MRSGDLLRIDFGFPLGSEAGLIRPAVVVGSDIVLHSFANTVTVVPLTTTLRARPSDVIVDDREVERLSVAECHLITTVSSRAVVDTIGNVGPVILAQIRSVLSDLLDIEP